MKKISLFKLFWTFFKINALTFGGGYTIVPIIKDIFVEDLKVISDDDMMDIVALAQGGPGAMAISASILTGYKLRGPLGALVCMSASVLPCLIILSLVAKFYREFKENFFINAALQGISGVISAVLFVTVFRMAKKSYKQFPGFTLVLIIISFILGYFTNINTSLIIFGSAMVGITFFTYVDRRYS